LFGDAWRSGPGFATGADRDAHRYRIALVSSLATEAAVLWHTIDDRNTQAMTLRYHDDLRP
jgi:hypothetical protein